MPFYSFRAECPADVEQFKIACVNAGVTTSLTEHPDEGLPDVDVELESAASIDTLRDLMRSVVDGHVVLQTIKECRLKDNSLERNYDLT